MGDVTDQVLAAIKSGHHTNRSIQIAILGRREHGGYSRDIDMSIQKLRKRGEIIWVKNKWHPAEQIPCTRCGGTGKEP